MSNVIITGGSRGIGAAAVELFAARGDRVWFLYEKNHAAAEVVAAKTGATAICCDVADGEAVKAAFREIPDVDILICNAGTVHYGLMSMMAESAWDRIFAVNVKGIYHCVNAALPFFLKKQKGSVVTVSSMWGQVGASCEAAYSATKGAVIALTKALAKELGPSGIRCNCVAPGVILTDMCAAVAKSSGDDPDIAPKSEKTVKSAPRSRNISAFSSSLYSLPAFALMPPPDAKVNMPKASPRWSAISFAVASRSLCAICTPSKKPRAITHSGIFDFSFKGYP